MTETQATARRAYRPDIDGLRAVAILSVVLFHAGLPGITGGFTGVDVFFVISGYLIGGHVFSEIRAGNFSFLRFYQRRAKRILPAFYTVLLFSLTAALVLLSPLEMKSFAHDALAAVLSVSNISFWHSINYFDSRTSLHPFLMTWSLGVEEQFYLVIPLSLVLVARFRRSLILPAILAVCVFSFALAWSELSRYPANVFYLLPERAWELGVGVAVAIIELTRKPLVLSIRLVQLLSVVGVASMLLPIFLLKSASPFPGPVALPSVLGSALTIALSASFFNRRILRLPPLVFIGRVSYSWYLWHWPLLAFLRICSDGSIPWFAATLAVVLSFILSVASYYFIEQPFRRSTLPAGPLLLRYASFSLVLLCLLGVVWVRNGIPQRFPQLERVDRVVDQWKSDTCLTFGSKSVDLQPPCYDAHGTRLELVLWGDSHAHALAPGLRAVTVKRGYDFVEFGRSSCQPISDLAIVRPREPEDADRCLSNNARVLSLIVSDPRIRIVVLTGRWNDIFGAAGQSGGFRVRERRTDLRFDPAIAQKLFTQHLASTLSAVQRSGKRVYLLDDVPYFAFDPILRLRTAHIPLRRALAAWMGSPDARETGTGPLDEQPAVDEAHSALSQVAAQFPAVPFVEIAGQFCGTGGACIYRLNTGTLYVDSQHLSPEGAAYALRDFTLPQAQRPGTSASPGL